jgi:hypothetical protein
MRTERAHVVDRFRPVEAVSRCPGCCGHRPGVAVDKRFSRTTCTARPTYARQNADRDELSVTARLLPRPMRRLQQLFLSRPPCRNRMPIGVVHERDGKRPSRRWPTGASIAVGTVPSERSEPGPRGRRPLGGKRFPRPAVVHGISPRTRSRRQSGSRTPRAFARHRRAARPLRDSGAAGRLGRREVHLPVCAATATGGAQSREAVVNVLITGAPRGRHRRRRRPAAASAATTPPPQPGPRRPCGLRRRLRTPRPRDHRRLAPPPA